LSPIPEQTASANHSKCWNWFNAIDQQRGQGEPSIIAGIAQQIIDEYPVNERQVLWPACRRAARWR
jgi:poly(3-hydroxybutyrate) depolymerase